LFLSFVSFAKITGGALPTHGSFLQKTSVLDFLDKGKGGVLLMESTFFRQDNPTGPPVARLVRSSFIRGLGGHGRKKLAVDPRPTPPPQPARAPDAVRLQKTEKHQALLYRLSGDYNPLHADPKIAQMVGFEKPILHGLCSFGFSTQAVLSTFPNVVVKSVQTRFSSPVLPGATLETRMWREGPEWILFETLADGKVALTGGAIQVSSSKL
jgi:acyl dehydratase